jgi:apolipoprotein N-acyltransferase
MDALAKYAKWKYYLILGIISSLLFYFSWPPFKYSFFLIFFAFIPLFLIEYLIVRFNKDKNTASRIFLISFISFFVWNVLSTFWIKNASFPGAVAAILINSLLMTMPLFIYHLINRMAKGKFSLLAFIAFWLAFEYIHLRWEFAWPWLSIGNVFAQSISLVQWYEFTGVLGGSLWVLLFNMILFYLLIHSLEGNTNIRLRKFYSGSMILLVLFPIIISKTIKIPDSIDTGRNIVVVQPNIDPYNEKFDTDFEMQLQKMLQWSYKGVDNKTLMFLWPETALNGGFDEDYILRNRHIKTILDSLNNQPDLKLLSGLDSYSFFDEGEELTHTARFSRYAEEYYDSYNGAIMLNKDGKHQIYHKSKLVPGVEAIPYLQYLGFMSKLTIDLGGTSGALAKSDGAEVFWAEEKIVAAPVICYESVFGDYVGDFVNKGANIITIITNDGWWGNTSGYKQHYLYAKLRAIETRKYVYRSANTGVSCIIDPSGKVLQKTDYWEPAILKSNIYINNKKTFYVVFGDLIGRIAAFTAVLFILFGVMRWFSGKEA